MRSIIRIAALTALLALGGFACQPPQVKTDPIPTTLPQDCAEDMPCWDWKTMGNHRRGICLRGVNWLEHADGTFEPGGRGCDVDPYTPPTNSFTSLALACASRLGIEWTHEDGATEELTAFEECTGY